MKIAIIEDETLAAKRLENLVLKYNPGIKIVAVLPSVKSSVKWLTTNPHPDLLFMDIHLEDGQSFAIFEQTEVDIPVIFTTAFDEYMVKAFKVNSIDYLLKPINYEELSGALAKYNKLHKAQMQLVQAEKMASLGQLTAGIAHEINNPINFVSANIEPLKNDIADVLEILHKYEEVIENKGLKAHFNTVDKLKHELELDYIRGEIHALLRGIEEGAVRTKEIVKGLRVFSRLDENAIKLFHIHEGLDSTLTLLKSKLGDRIEVIKNYGNLPSIEGFPGKINQVFMNILINAVHAMPERGKIFITTSVKENFVQISIRDTGTGMSEEVKSRIFEPFFTTKDVGEGIGLGLAISFGVIEQHKGNIAVESVLGKGTEFIVTLPIKQN